MKNYYYYNNSCCFVAVIIIIIIKIHYCLQKGLLQKKKKSNIVKYLLQEVDPTQRIWNNTAMFIWIQQSGKQGRMVSKYLEVLRMIKDIVMMGFLPGTHGWRGWAHTSDQHRRWARVTDEDKQT